MRAAVRLLLVLFTFAIPWEYSLDLGEPIGNIARIAGVALLLAAVPAILLAGQIRTPGRLQWLTLILFLWLCLTCLWTIDRGATLMRLRAYFQGMMTVWIAWEFADGPDDLRDLLRAYVGGCWILALLTIANFVSPGMEGQIRFVPDGQDPNDVARFLDFGFPMAAFLAVGERSWAGRLLAMGYLPLGIMGVLLTASRGGFLAAVVALAGCAFLMLRGSARRILAGIVLLPAIAVSVGLLVPRETLRRLASIPQQIQGGDLNQRWQIWQAGWMAFVHAPLLGAGAGTFVSAAGLAPEDTSHNTALAVAVEGGLIALILFASIVIACAWLVMKTRGAVRIAMATSLLVWTVSSLVATVEQTRTTWLLFALISVAARRFSEVDSQLEPDSSLSVRYALRRNE